MDILCTFIFGTLELILILIIIIIIKGLLTRNNLKFMYFSSFLFSLASNFNDNVNNISFLWHRINKALKYYYNTLQINHFRYLNTI